MGAAATASTLAASRSPVLAQQTAAAAAGTLPVKRIEDVFGVSGTIQPGGVLSFDFPRTDFHSKLFGISVDPDFGFDTEITFQAADDDRAIVKWEYCLRDGEVNKAMDVLLAASLNPPRAALGALHNHFLDPQPEVKFLHGTALGFPVEIAKGLVAVLKAVDHPIPPPAPPGNTGLPNKKIAQIIGGTPEVSGIILRVSVERPDEITELGVRLEPAMQVEHVFLFQHVQGQAAVDAEFVLLSDEVDPVARSLRGNGFTLMGLHHHELFEVVQPASPPPGNPMFPPETKLYYLHAFKTDAGLELAREIRKALDQAET